MSFFRPRTKGFSVVELVAVILMLGILGSLGLGRLVNPSGFDKRNAADALISLSRSVQQSALVKSSASLKIETSGASLAFSEVVSGATSTTRSFPTNKVSITAGTLGSGASCSSITSTITLNFDSAGEIETVDDDGFPICLNGESSLCISPAGFAHEGACL